MSFSSKQKLQSNIQAIKIAFAIKRQKRNATSEEIEILNRYVGFGGIKSILNPVSIEHWKEHEKPLYEDILTLHQIIKDNTDSEFVAKQYLESAKESVLTSFYTPGPIVDILHEAIRDTGIKINTYLEPSAGVGVFIDKAENILSISKENITAFEIDKLTGLILQGKNNKSNIQVKGFERIEKNNFDLIMSNIPFGNFPVIDTSIKFNSRSSNPILKQSTNAIHTYFFTKGLDCAREGGVVAFITSQGVMDAPSHAPIRQYLMENAHLVSAVRLPNNLFLDNANTKIGTDLIILQKQTSKNLSEDEQAFVKSSNLSGVNINNYYLKHEDRFLCDYTLKETNQFGKPVLNLYYEHDDIDIIAKELKAVLDQDLVERLNKILFETNLIQQKITATPIQTHTPSVSKQLNLFDEFLFIENKKEKEIEIEYKEEIPFYFKQKTMVLEPNSQALGLYSQNKFEILNVNEKEKEIFAQYAKVRDSYARLFEHESVHLAEHSLLRAELNKNYEDFTIEYGSIHEHKFLNSDALYRETAAIEVVGEDKKWHKSDIFSFPVAFSSKQIQASSADEALIISLNEKGTLDLDFMTRLYPIPKDEMVKLLDDKIIYNPINENYETKENFLSGNVVYKIECIEKLEQAKKEQVQHSLHALKSALPPVISFDEIGINLGERWIPTATYEKFASQLFDNTDFTIYYDNSTDNFIITNNLDAVFGRHISNSKIDIEYAYSNPNGRRRYYGTDILLYAMSDTLPEMTKTIIDKHGKEAKITDTEGMAAVQQIINRMKEKWEDYLQNLPLIEKQKIEKIYNAKFNCYVKPNYDGRFQTFPNLDFDSMRQYEKLRDINSLYDSQKDAIWMLKQNGGGIIDHEVGGGKTLIMCIAANEMKRLGIAHKPMIIAMKANVEEIANTYKSAFPKAKVLAPTEKDYTGDRKISIFNNIKNNDYDVIILSHEQFKAIPQDENIIRQVVQNKIENLERNIKVVENEKSRSVSKIMLSNLIRSKKNLEKKLHELNSDLDKIRADVVTFRKMGIDHIIVDESHEFKNLGFETRHSRVAGLGNTKGSMRAANLLYAIRDIQERGGGKDLGATFCSGTPISNSLTELYNIFNYLRPNELHRQDIESFDAWAAVFTKKTTEFEFSVTNEITSKERFRYFIKAPELAMFYSQITDYKTAEDIGIDRPKLKQTLISLEPTKEQKIFIERLKDFAHNGNEESLGPKKRDFKGDVVRSKMLLATNLSRNMSLDMRMIDDQYYIDDPNNKASQVANKIYEYYKKYDQQQGTQFVFSDLGTYKPNEWNIYSTIAEKLIDMGIPKNEIAFIQQCGTKAKQDEVINKMNSGEIRVMFGSTKTMGTGINAQQRVIAMHHLDIPWRPSDLEQRNGRGKRKGNWVAKQFCENIVNAYIYGTKGSLDSYQFNLLHNKQTFINQLKQGAVGSRILDEGACDENNGMSFSEYVAVLSGNTDLLEKVKLEKQIMSLENDRKIFNNKISDTKILVENSRIKIDQQEQYLGFLNEDLQHFKNITKMDKEGNIINALQVEGIAESAPLKDKGKKFVSYKDIETKPDEYRKIGNIYGFDVVVNTKQISLETTTDGLFSKEILKENKFYVQGHFKYSYNNASLANDPLLAVENPIKALTTSLPRYVEKAEEKLANLKQPLVGVDDILLLKWGKEERLTELKTALKILETKITEDIKNKNYSLSQGLTESHEKKEEVKKYEIPKKMDFPYKKTSPSMRI